MTSPFETDEFKKLQREWAQKLKDDGFEDIEGTPGKNKDGPFSALLHLRETTMYRQREADGTADLFQMADQWMERGRFRNRRERFYFRAWANGRSIRDIFENHPAEPTTEYVAVIESINRHVRDMVEEGLEWTEQGGTDDE